MNGFILGFQRRVWWPKWTPASSSCRIEMAGTVVGPPGCIRRGPSSGAGRALAGPAPPRSERSACELRYASWRHTPGELGAPGSSRGRRSLPRGPVGAAPPPSHISDAVPVVAKLAIRLDDDQVEAKRQLGQRGPVPEPADSPKRVARIVEAPPLRVVDRLLRQAEIAASTPPHFDDDDRGRRSRIDR